jgi:hypothetical protein
MGLLSSTYSEVEPIHESDCCVFLVRRVQGRTHNNPIHGAYVQQPADCQKHTKIRRSVFLKRSFAFARSRWSIIDRTLGSAMSVADRDADENGLLLDLYLSISRLFSGEMPSVSIKQIGYGESDTVAKPSLDQLDSPRLARGIQKRFRQRYRREHEMSV